MTTRDDFHSPPSPGHGPSEPGPLSEAPRAPVAARPVPTLQAQVPALFDLEDRGLIHGLASTFAAWMPPICLEAASEAPVCSVIDLLGGGPLLEQTVAKVKEAGHRARAQGLDPSAEAPSPGSASLLFGVDALARWDGANGLLRFASRCLRPGGRLALVDVYLSPDLRAEQLDEVDRNCLNALSRYRWNAPLKTASQLDWLAGRFDLEPIEDVDVVVGVLEAPLRSLKSHRDGLRSRLGRALQSLKSEGVSVWTAETGRRALSYCLDAGLIEVRMRVWQRLSPVSMEVEDSGTVH